MRWVAWWGVVGSLGCSAPNAAYDEPRTSDTGTGDVSVGPTGPATTDEPGGTEDSGGVETSGRCELHDETPLRLSVFEAETRVEPNCTPGNEMYFTGPVRIQYPPPDTIQATVCEDPTCGACSGDDVWFELEGSLVLPPGLPNCGRIVAWAGEGDDGCQWRGWLMQQQSEVLPYFLASNVRDPLPLSPFELGLSPVTACEGQCNSGAPGQHALVAFGTAFTVEASPVEIDVDFVGGGVTYPYEFVDRMSSVTEECREQVSWTALRKR